MPFMRLPLPQWINAKKNSFAKAGPTPLAYSNICKNAIISFGFDFKLSISSKNLTSFASKKLVPPLRLHGIPSSLSVASMPSALELLRKITAISSYGICDVFIECDMA